jgi:putative zinc finger/helix-turn-helix YgiT family protein
MGVLFCPNCEQNTAFKTVMRNHDIAVRGETFCVSGEVDLCESCGEILWNEKYDGLLARAYEMYKKKHGLLSSGEIRDIRTSYNLSQDVFAAILGIGSASLQRYETGAVQTIPYDRLLREASDAKRLLDLLETNRSRLSEEAYRAAKENIRKKTAPDASSLRRHLLAELQERPSDFNGFRSFSPDSFHAVIARLLSRLKDSCAPITKLHKLLFYIDFLSFKTRRISMTGLCYVHWPHGPVPGGALSYDLYDSASEAGIVRIEEEECDDGNIKRTIALSDGTVADIPDPEERRIIDRVADALGKLGARELSALSHNEDAYMRTRDKERISYAYAATLKAIR